MSKVKASISMSLDGFIAGPSQSEQHPLGVGGMRLHEWKFSLQSFREWHGEEGGDVRASKPIAEEILGDDVSIGGGANVLQQYLAAGLLDAMLVSLVPIFLGGGASQAAALTGGYHVAFLVGAIFALVAAGLGAFLVRRPTAEATHARDEPVGEPAPCAFTVGDQGVPEHQLQPA